MAELPFGSATILKEAETTLPPQSHGWDPGSLKRRAASTPTSSSTLAARDSSRTRTCDPRTDTGPLSAIMFQVAAAAARMSANGSFRPSVGEGRATANAFEVFPHMPKSSPKTKLRPQPNVLFEATVRRMLGTPHQPKKAAAKKRRPNTRKKRAPNG